eukprot:scaffold33472_cov101-Isochrysis_galbana.AAC.3
MATCAQASSAVCRATHAVSTTHTDDSPTQLRSPGNQSEASEAAAAARRPTAQCPRAKGLPFTTSPQARPPTGHAAPVVFLFLGRRASPLHGPKRAPRTSQHVLQPFDGVLALTLDALKRQRRAVQHHPVAGHGQRPTFGTAACRRRARRTAVLLDRKEGRPVPRLPIAPQPDSFRPAPLDAAIPLGAPARLDPPAPLNTASAAQHPEPLHAAKMVRAPKMLHAPEMVAQHPQRKPQLRRCRRVSGGLAPGASAGHVVSRSSG